MMARAMALSSLDQLEGNPTTKCPLLMFPIAMPTNIMPRGPGSPTYKSQRVHHTPQAWQKG